MQETVSLSDPGSPLQIEYSRAAMEQIRQRAREGLMAAPRVGMGVGGLLLGVRQGARIRLLDSIDIPCSHSAGPSFDLTADEKRQSSETIAEAGAPGVSRKVGVIGWYCSKTRGDANLNESDRSLYAELFPDPWQVALVVRPRVMEAMHAAFFFRDESGAVVKGIECDVDEWRPEPNAPVEAVGPERQAETAARPQGEKTNAPEPIEAISVEAPGVLSKPALPNVIEIGAPPPKPVEPRAPAQTTKPAETRLADIIDLTSPDTGIEADAGPVARQTPVRPASFFDAPGFTAPQPHPRSRIRLALPIAAALLAAGVVGFVTREFWMPKPPLTLNSTELNGTLLIRWNPDALRGVDHASMFVNDGGQPAPSLIPLDRFQLNSGLLSYTPKSERVTAKLDAGETSAITAWFKPAPAPAPAGGNDASPPAAGPNSAKAPATSK